MRTMTPDRPKRKAIPLHAQLEAALRQLAEYMGCERNELDLDHSPALELRPVENGQHVPHQHDPKHLYWMHRPAHNFKTNGRKGESKLSIDSNSDKGRIAKVKRLEKKRLAQPPRDCVDCGEGPCYMNCGPVVEVLDAVVRDAKRQKRTQWAQGRKIQSRGFQKNPKKKPRPKR